jgi:hypothetical protein
VERNIKRRQTLLAITSREVREERVKLSKEREKKNAARTKGEKVSNCTEGPVQQEHVEEKAVRVSGLKVMGVFTLCGVLVMLG